MQDAMLAAVYYGPEDLRVEQRPVPPFGDGEALLRVTSTGICGTDLRIWHGAHRKYPPGTVRIPGHEVVGTIAAVGRAVSGLPVGERVFVAPNMGCGHCRQCISGDNNRCADYEAIGITMDGSFAEYMRIPAAAITQGNLIPIGEEVDPAVASLAEPLACVVRGQDVLQIQPGETVLIVGAGPIGILHLLLARLRGAGRVIVSEARAERAAQAGRLGADRTVNPAEENLAEVVKTETKGQGADVIIVAAPAHQAQEESLQLAAIGGRINFFGGLPQDRPNIHFDSNLVHYKELMVTATTACSTSDCWKAAAIINSNHLDLSPLIGARLPLSAAVEAFKTSEAGRTLKVIMNPG